MTSRIYDNFQPTQTFLFQGISKKKPLGFTNPRWYLLLIYLFLASESFMYSILPLSETQGTIKTGPT